MKSKLLSVVLLIILEIRNKSPIELFTLARPISNSAEQNSYVICCFNKSAIRNFTNYSTSVFHFQFLVSMQFVLAVHVSPLRSFCIKSGYFR